jgi:hypothetical protein
LRELGLALELLEHGGVGLDMCHRPVPSRLRNALGERAAAEMLAPDFEALRLRGARGNVRHEERGRGEAGSEQRSPRRDFEGIRPGHARSLREQEQRRQNDRARFHARAYCVPLDSGHIGSFDRRKCKGPLNGPGAERDDKCPDGNARKPSPSRPH